MKQILIVFACALMVFACNNFAKAQNQASAVVGNPDSDNLLMIEEDYQVMTQPTAQPQAPMPADMSQEGNVEVAPVPQQVPAQPNQPTDAAMPAVVVDETTEVDTPDASALEASETVYQ